MPKRLSDLTQKQKQQWRMKQKKTWRTRTRGTRRQLGKKFPVETESMQGKKSRLPTIAGKGKVPKRKVRLSKFEILADSEDIFEFQQKGFTYVEAAKKVWKGWYPLISKVSKRQVTNRIRNEIRPRERAIEVAKEHLSRKHFKVWMKEFEREFYRKRGTLSRAIDLATEESAYAVMRDTPISHIKRGFNQILRKYPKLKDKFSKSDRATIIRGAKKVLNNPPRFDFTIKGAIEVAMEKLESKQTLRGRKRVPRKKRVRRKIGKLISREEANYVLVAKKTHPSGAESGVQEYFIEKPRAENRRQYFKNLGYRVRVSKR